jgi:catalase
VLYDAVAVPCGPDSAAALSSDGYAVHFVAEAYKHAKALAAFGAGLDVLRAAHLDVRLAENAADDVVVDKGVVSTTKAENTVPPQFAERFATLIAGHRVWERPTDHIVA